MHNHEYESLFTDEEKAEISREQRILIGDKMKEGRKRKGHSQAESARIVGISGASWSRLEANHNIPSRDTMARLSSYLGIPYQTLLFYAGYNTTDEDYKFFDADGAEIDVTEMVEGLYEIDPELLKALSDFVKIEEGYKEQSSKDIQLIKTIISNLGKEACLSDSKKNEDIMFLKAFRALKDFILASFA